MSLAGLNVHNTTTFKSAGGKLYKITIQVKNAFGGWTPINVIADTGNEISIMKHEEAQRLGLNLEQGEHFRVAGINGPGREFRRFKMYIKIGTLEPILATIGFATKPGDLVENLLGNENLAKSGKLQVTYEGDNVTITQKALAARVATCSDHVTEQQLLNNLYEHQTTLRKRFEIKHKDAFRDIECAEGSGNSIPGYLA